MSQAGEIKLSEAIRRAFARGVRAVRVYQELARHKGNLDLAGRRIEKLKGNDFKKGKECLNARAR